VPLIHTVPAPSLAIVRVAGIKYRPFTTAPWSIDPATGGLKRPPVNRFDDIGPILGIPRAEWFQTVYAATTLESALGELLAFRRLSVHASSAVVDIERQLSESDRSSDESIDPAYPNRGTVPARWRNEKQNSAATIADARFINVSHPGTLSFLRSEFVSEFLHRTSSPEHDRDFDLSDVMSRNRRLTQHLARYLHDLPREAFGDLKDGEEIAGIRYLSRHSPEWECWALFADRIEGRLAIGESRPIEADDSDLLAVAKHFGLSVETDTPGQYLRPWLDS
jgi:hypothetical protein